MSHADFTPLHAPETDRMQAVEGNAISLQLALLLLHAPYLVSFNILARRHHAIGCLQHMLRSSQSRTAFWAACSTPPDVLSCQMRAAKSRVRARYQQHCRLWLHRLSVLQ